MNDKKPFVSCTDAPPKWLNRRLKNDSLWYIILKLDFNVN